MADSTPMYVSVPQSTFLWLGNTRWRRCFCVWMMLVCIALATTTTTTNSGLPVVEGWQPPVRHPSRANPRYGRTDSSRSGVVASSWLFCQSSLPLSFSLSLFTHSSSSCVVRRDRHCRPLFSASNDNDNDKSKNIDSDSNTNNNHGNDSQPIVIDGKKTAAAIRAELAEEIKNLQASHGITPGLAVVLVGQRVDSATYVRMKKKAAAEVGIHSIDVVLEETISEDALLEEIEKLNADPAVHGILVQLPLPDHMDEAKVLRAIDYAKDADGFDAVNIGNLWLRGGEPPLAIPCTPAGCIELLQRYNIPISGKECVVLGRSNIVGMPVAALLQSCNGTVTVCHSRTANIPETVKRADIVIAAIGKAEFVRGEWLKEGAVVIDVGINDKPDPTKKRGYRLVGDVNYQEAVDAGVSAITPVPGGVGPMTIAMLLKNTVNLCLHSKGLPRLQLRDRTLDGDYKADASSKLVNTSTTK